MKNFIYSTLILSLFSSTLAIAQTNAVITYPNKDILLTGGTVSNPYANPSSINVGGVNTSATGGSINLAAASSMNYGGSINLSLPAQSSNPGNINFIMPNGLLRIGTNVSTFPITITGSGNISTTGTITTGNLTGAASSYGTPGNIKLYSADSYRGGNIEINAGNGTSGTNYGGNVNINVGSGYMNKGVINIGANSYWKLFVNTYLGHHELTGDLHIIGDGLYGGLVTDNGVDCKYLNATGDVYANSLTTKGILNTDSFNLQFQTLGITRIVIQNSNGNVLIGKTTQTNINYKLEVEGKIRASEIVVNSTGVDFVFDKNYKHLSLTDLEQYVKINKHLPEVPSASEMQTNGVSLSDMQTKLLQKVEELTLYMIELKKENELLKEEIEKIKNK